MFPPSVLPDITHVRKCTRPSPAFPYCKRQNAGWGPGTTLQCTYTVHAITSAEGRMRLYTPVYYSYSQRRPYLHTTVYYSNFTDCLHTPAYYSNSQRRLFVYHSILQYFTKETVCTPQYTTVIHKGDCLYTTCSCGKLQKNTKET